MRVGKWVSGIAAGIVLLVVSLVLIVTLVVDPNRFKPRVERLVRETTGEPFTIRGDLDISWYPWLALRMGAAQLGEDQPLMSWQTARIGARLLPLLRGELVIDRVRFDGLRLRLERSADGQTSWERPLSARDRSTGGGPQPRLGGLEIRNGSLEYFNAASGTRAAMLNWSLDVGEWQAGRPFSVKSRFGLRQGAPGKPVVPVEVDIPRIRLAPDPLSFDMPSFELQIAGATVTGGVALQGAKPLNAKGQLSIETSSLRTLLTDLSVGGPRPRSKDVLAEMKLSAQWSADDGAIVVKPVDVRFDETRFTGEMARSAGDDPLWSFQLTGDRIDLGRYVALEETDDEPFELPTAALKALRARGVLSFSEARLATAQMKDVRVSLELEDGALSGSKPQPVP